MEGRGERVQEGVVGFLGRYYGTHENGFYLLSHHWFSFLEFANDFQSVGMLGEYWGLHLRWGALSLHRYMQFLQGAELQNGPNLEAWVASGATSGAGCHWNPEELSCGGDGTEATVSALHLEGLWRARKLSLSQDDVSNENRRNLLVTTSQDLLVYSRSTFIFVCELRATQWGVWGSPKSFCRAVLLKVWWWFWKRFFPTSFSDTAWK